MKLIQSKMNNKISPLVLLSLASGLAMSSAAAAAAQSGWAQPQDHMEYEPGEGLHEEEWYDPTDWWDDDFDGVRGPDIDYEDMDRDDDWYDHDYEYDDDSNYTRAVYDGHEYDASWWGDSDTELYNDGYSSGYYDGYRDEEFGYDYQSASADESNGYSTGYSAGYYDGYYDQQRGYDSDWTYYLYMTPVDERRAESSRERDSDDSRERGDRSVEARTDRMARSEASKDAKQREMTRKRGTVTKVQRLKDSELRSAIEDHQVLRLTFEDGRTIVVDLGTESKSGVIEKGDRVTVSGKRVSHDGRRMLDVSRLSVNDEVMWNSKHEDMPQQMSSR